MINKKYGSNGNVVIPAFSRVQQITRRWRRVYIWSLTPGMDKGKYVVVFHRSQDFVWGNRKQWKLQLYGVVGFHRSEDLIWGNRKQWKLLSYGEMGKTGTAVVPNFTSTKTIALRRERRNNTAKDETGISDEQRCQYEMR